MVRRHCVMLSMNPIKAIVTADHLYLIAPRGADTVLQETFDHIKSLFDNDDNIVEEATSSSSSSLGSSFELKSYKAVLSTICSLHYLEKSNIVAYTDNLLLALGTIIIIIINITIIKIFIIIIIIISTWKIYLRNRISRTYKNNKNCSYFITCQNQWI